MRLPASVLGPSVGFHANFQKCGTQTLRQSLSHIALPAAFCAYHTILYTIYYILYTIYYILYTIYYIPYNVLYYTILYYTLLYSTLLYSTLLYSTLLYSTLLYSTLLYSTLLYSTLLYSTILYYTILYRTTCHSAGVRGPRLDSPIFRVSPALTVWSSREPGPDALPGLLVAEV